MDKLILGLLMLKRLTVYEIRAVLGRDFGAMCSDSLGGIQAAVRKLLAAGMVTYTEYVEKGVNKKRYSITGIGREEFMSWLKVPADMTASKNMEIGKFLFMGLVPAEKRLPLIDGIIQQMETELSKLQTIWDYVQNSGATGKNEVVEYWNADAEYLEGIRDATQNTDANGCANGIGMYQIYSLRYGIENLQFNIDWFRALHKKIASGKQDIFPIIGGSNS
jgi:DNA-binding PadR family transcriptional regulator